jgi:hypothetical protein
MTEQAEITLTANDPPLNYFNYFTEVEDAFVRRRGKHLLLCSLDWTLIEVWKERGIPLHIVLRGIERWFDFYETKRRRRSINMLMYCQEEVEAQYVEWLESRVGAAEEPTSVEGKNEGLPFSRAAILEHLRRGRSTLSAVCVERLKAGEDDFSEILKRVVGLLAELEQDLEAVASPDAQKLEQSLSGLERMLSDALCSVASTEQMKVIESEVKEQLKPYRKQMEPAVYQQTVDNLLLKRLREQFGIPRLSLFYL